MDTADNARLHYLDALRGVLMVLGVVLHSARPYDSNPWQVKDVVRLEWLDVVVSAIHLFRMPAFFMVAGYFAMFLLARQAMLPFLRERMRRVLVPLLATLVTFNVVQVWVVLGSGGDAGFVQGALLPAWAAGQWLSHLWFLVILAVFLGLTALFAPGVRRLAGARVQALIERRWVLPVLLAAAVAGPLAVAVAGRLAGPVLTERILGTVALAEILRYLPAFGLGMLLRVSPVLLQRFARRDWTVLALAAGGFAGMALTAGRDGDAYRAAHMLAEALASWMLVRVLFSAFRDLASRPSPFFAYLSSASYSIYLFHHLTAVSAATVLLSAPWPAETKFLAVLALTALVPTVLHHFLVRRYAALGYLFNGRTAVRARSSIAEPRAQSARADDKPAPADCAT